MAYVVFIFVTMVGLCATSLFPRDEIFCKVSASCASLSVALFWTTIIYGVRFV